MSPDPFIGEFWLLEGLRHDGQSFALAIGTDSHRLIELVKRVGEDHPNEFLAFRLLARGGYLLTLGVDVAQPTHPIHPTSN